MNCKRHLPIVAAFVCASSLSLADENVQHAPSGVEKSEIHISDPTEIEGPDIIIEMPGENTPPSVEIVERVENINFDAEGKVGTAAREDTTINDETTKKE